MTETCIQVVNAYSKSSQLETLCLDPAYFEITEVTDDLFYGTIASGPDMDMLWVLVAGCMVFLMQSGFTMLEAGTVKVGNVQNILFKNLMDACLGAICFYLFGYAVAYGDGECTVGGFMGCKNVALSSLPVDWNSFFFQWAFAATAATIVSGSVAERCSLTGYFLYTTTLTVLVYPVVVHWFWSGTGWLSPFNDAAHFEGGVIDFAGSGVVHMVGGWSGLCGAVALGPRLNRFRYDDAGKDSPAQSDNEGVAVMTRSLSKIEQKQWKVLQDQHALGNNVPFQVVGTLILWFGWYGFNPGSTLAANGAMELASKVAVTSTLAAAGGGVVASSLGRVLEGYFSLPRVCNGILAGLVSITAPCAVVETGDALAIGAMGAVVYYTASRFLERLEVDDPLDAWAVHGCCGMWGVISVGFFASSENVAFAGYNDVLVEASKGYRLSLQMFAVFMIIVWTVSSIGGMFFVLKYVGILRVPEAVERSGLDIADHGGVAVDYKRGYKIESREVRAAMTVFGRGHASGQSGSNSFLGESSEDEAPDGAAGDGKTFSSNVVGLSTGTTGTALTNVPPITPAPAAVSEEAEPGPEKFEAVQMAEVEKKEDKADDKADDKAEDNAEAEAEDDDGASEEL